MRLKSTKPVIYGTDFAVYCKMYLWYHSLKVVSEFFFFLGTTYAVVVLLDSYIYFPCCELLAPWVFDYVIHYSVSLAPIFLSRLTLSTYFVLKYLFVLQRNYRFFFMFVFSTTLLCLFVFGFCWVHIKMIMDTEQSSIWRAMIRTPASIVLIVYTFIAVWFVGGLTAFHLYLISTNQVRTFFPF